MVSPDLTQPTHRFEEEDTLRGILFLRLKTSHLRPKYRVFNGNHYVTVVNANLTVQHDAVDAPWSEASGKLLFIMNR